MRGDGLVVDNALRDTVLVSADSGHDRQRAGVDLRTAVANDTNDDLLPAVLSPCFGAVARTY